MINSGFEPKITSDRLFHIVLSKDTTIFISNATDPAFERLFDIDH